MNHTLGAIILAAGQGKRMQSTDRNKVTMPLSGKPIILHIVEFMKKLSIDTILVVVGFAKESVREALHSQQVLFVEQTERLGTGHAVQVTLEKIPSQITDVIVVYGDDGVFYSESQRPIFEKLIASHLTSHAALTFLTIEQDNPLGLGRIVRDEQDALIKIVEEKDATDEERKITEINPGCFVFSIAFLKKYLPLVEKSPITGEYYLISLIDLGLKNGERVEAVKGGHLLWRGVNTPQELQEAERLYNGTKI